MTSPCFRPGALRRAAGLDVAHQRPARVCQAEALRQVGRHALHRHAQLRAVHHAVARSAGRLTARAIVEGIAKPRPMLPPEGDRICALMPTSSPCDVDQRAAGVALVDRRVGLQEVLVAAVADAGRAALGADDAHRHGLADAERVAERQHHVADVDVVRITERRRSAGRRPTRSTARSLAGPLRPGSRRSERPSARSTRTVGAGDDVVVGQDVAVGADDHARTEPAFDARRGACAAELPAEELAERLAGRWWPSRAGLLLDADGDDHGGRHAVDDPAVGRRARSRRQRGGLARRGRLG